MCVPKQKKGYVMAATTKLAGTFKAWRFMLWVKPEHFVATIARCAELGVDTAKSFLWRATEEDFGIKCCVPKDKVPNILLFIETYMITPALPLGALGLGDFKEAELSRPQAPEPCRSRDIYGECPHCYKAHYIIGPISDAIESGGAFIMARHFMRDGIICSGTGLQPKKWPVKPPADQTPGSSEWWGSLRP